MKAIEDYMGNQALLEGLIKYGFLERGPIGIDVNGQAFDISDLKNCYRAEFDGLMNTARHDELSCFIDEIAVKVCIAKNKDKIPDIKKLIQDYLKYPDVSKVNIMEHPYFVSLLENNIINYTDLCIADQVFKSISFTMKCNVKTIKAIIKEYEKPSEVVTKSISNNINDEQEWNDKDLPKPSTYLLEIFKGKEHLLKKLYEQLKPEEKQKPKTLALHYEVLSKWINFETHKKFHDKITETFPNIGSYSAFMRDCKDIHLHPTPTDLNDLADIRRDYLGEHL